MQSGIFCIIADSLIKSEIYSAFVQVLRSSDSVFFTKGSLACFLGMIIFNLQAHLAPSGYLKLPNVSGILLHFTLRNVIMWSANNPMTIFSCFTTLLLLCILVGMEYLKSNFKFAKSLVELKREQFDKPQCAHSKIHNAYPICSRCLVSVSLFYTSYCLKRKKWLHVSSLKDREELTASGGCCILGF